MAKPNISLLPGCEKKINYKVNMAEINYIKAPFEITVGLQLHKKSSNFQN